VPNLWSCGMLRFFHRSPCYQAL